MSCNKRDSFYRYITNSMYLVDVSGFIFRHRDGYSYSRLVTYIITESTRYAYNLLNAIIVAAAAAVVRVHTYISYVQYKYVLYGLLHGKSRMQGSTKAYITARNEHVTCLIQYLLYV